MTTVTDLEKTNLRDAGIKSMQYKIGFDKF